MKFSDFYFAPISRVIAGFLGVMSGLAVGLFFGWQIGVLAGAGVALVSSVLVPLKVYMEERPYLRIKESLQEKILLDRRVHFTVQGGTMGGYFILTASTIIFLSMEDGEHRLEFARDDVQSITVSRDMSIRVALNDKQFVRMVAVPVDDIGRVLLENGWSVIFDSEN